VVAWAFSATLAFGYFRGVRGVASIKFTDTIFPTRWHRVKSALGVQIIEEGLSLYRTGRHAEAIHFLNSGLSKFPSHAAARIAAAEIRVLYGRPEAAAQILIDGLVHFTHDEMLLGSALQLISTLGAEEVFLRAISGVFSTGKSDPRVSGSCRGRLALSAATAAFKLGRFEAAENWFRALDASHQGLETQLLRSRIDWERGHRNLALCQLRALVDSQSAASAELHGELILRLRQLGHVDEWRRRAISLSLAHPNIPRARIELLHAYHASNDGRRVTHEIESLIREFPANRDIVLGIAEFAVTTAQPTLTERLCPHAIRFGLPVEPFRFLHVEAMLAASDSERAQKEIRAIRRDLSRTIADSTALDCLQAATHFALGDVSAAKGSIQTVIKSRRPQPSQLLALANRFASLGGLDEACLILEHILSIQPTHQSALTRLVEIHLNSNLAGSLPAHLVKLAALRRPDPDLLRVARHKLGSDRFLFAPERNSALAAIEAALEGRSVAGH
jgi:tetratricopeptide (TPR) repeat protein